MGGVKDMSKQLFASLMIVIGIPVFMLLGFMLMPWISIYEEWVDDIGKAKAERRRKDRFSK